MTDSKQVEEPTDRNNESNKSSSGGSIASRSHESYRKFTVETFDEEKPLVEPVHPFATFTPQVFTKCSITPTTFASVMFNLVRNPNITSSHLFRADIFYDSVKDASYAPLHYPQEWEEGTMDLCSLAKHMKASYKPSPIQIQGWKMVRTIVREMVPRNPNLDRPLAQTCCFYCKGSTETDSHSELESVFLDTEGEVVGDAAHGSYMVLYIPHVSQEAEIPYYHPKVKALSFLYEWYPPRDSEADENCVSEGRLSIHTAHFSTETTTTSHRLTRTLNNLLSTIHRHGTGRQQGYVKRVEHDLVVPQARFQNTYTRLKLAYATRLTKDWREVTDPTKHVFEDLGIAAWLMELWRDMYGIDPSSSAADKKRQYAQAGFAGFVDIGCGNGALVTILCWEGYEGWGFDVRRRKSWNAFEEDERVKGKLTELVLVPEVLNLSSAPATSGGQVNSRIVNGIFPKGTFIISNHADELTPWTPLLAYLSHNAAFLAIPCCSHDLTGARTRFPPQKKGMNGQGEAVGKQSAYQTLCDYTERLSSQVGYTARREHLRIPSTRNIGILGLPRELTGYENNSAHSMRQNDGSAAALNPQSRLEEVKVIVETELAGRSIEDIANGWRQRTEKLQSIKSDRNH